MSFFGEGYSVFSWVISTYAEDLLSVLLWHPRTTCECPNRRLRLKTAQWWLDTRFWGVIHVSVKRRFCLVSLFWLATRSTCEVASTAWPLARERVSAVATCPTGDAHPLVRTAPHSAPASPPPPPYQAQLDYQPLILFMDTETNVSLGCFRIFH